MVGQKFYVYGGGRWREINLSTGRVAGWGAVQYLSVRRGRLNLARKNAVLHGFKALASGKPTSIYDGPQLSQIRNVNTKIIEAKPVNNECQHHQHCCQNNIHCNTVANLNSMIKPVTSTVATQCTISSTNTKVMETSIIEKPVVLVAKSNNINKVKTNDTGNGTAAKRKRASSDSSDVFNSDSQKSNIDVELNTPLHQLVKLSHSQEPCKELLISEEDVLLIRTFIEQDDNNMFGVDLERFDSDDFYKRLVFYKLNPLVNVEQCKIIHGMIPNKTTLTESFKYFVNSLGLQTVEEASQVSNKKYKIRPRRNRVKPGSSSKEFDKENMRIEIVSIKSRRSGGVSGGKVNKVAVLRDTKSGQFKPFTGLVKGSKAGPASKNRNDATSNDLLKKKYLENNKDGLIKNKNNKANDESVKKNETVKRSEPSKRFYSMKGNKLHNENKLIENDDSEKKLNEATDKKVTRKNKKKVSDKVISSELNSKDALNDSDTMVLSSDSEDKQSDKIDTAKMPRLAVPTKRLYVRGNSARQPYTEAEDAVLVQWVRDSGRARLVNGNNIWRELQPIFQKKTGRFRSWHSLRNRYLRHLLPTLGTMSIPQDEAARLRAAAAVGDLKSKKMQPNNSIYKEKRVMSAWSRRPRSPLRNTSSPSPSVDQSSPRSSIHSHSSDYSTETIKSLEKWNNEIIGAKDEKAKRTLNSSAIRSPPKRSKQKQINIRSPTYSELTKRFALKYSTPDSHDSDTNIYRNTDKNIRPTRSSRRKNANVRQDAESSEDQTKTIRHNSKTNKTGNFIHSRERTRQVLTVRQNAGDSDDESKAKQLRSVDRQNSKSNNLNNSRKRARQISTDRQEIDTSDDQKKLKSHILENNKSNFNVIKRRGNLIGRRNAGSRPDESDGEILKSNQQNSKSNKRTRKTATDRQDTDTDGDQTKTKQLNSNNNNLHKSRKSTRKSSTYRQETDSDDQSKVKSLRNTVWRRSKNNKSARKSSTEQQDSDTSYDEAELKKKSKTNNLNKSRNESSKSRQDSSDDEKNKKSNRLLNSRNVRDSINNLNGNKQNNMNGNKRKSNKMSNDTSDFEHDLKPVKNLRSSNVKADTRRPKTRRLYNPKELKDVLSQTRKEIDIF